MDAFRFEVKGIRELETELRRIDRSVDRASMWAVREAGRKVKQEARRQVRVYTGPRPDVPKGRLKKSIASSKRLRRDGAAVGVTVGPRGWPARGYAAKIEELDGYMRRAYETVAPLLREIAERAWTRASRGRR